MQSMLPNVLQPNTTDHVPVLADEVRELLALEPGKTLVDGTFGAGGHASLLARDFHGNGKVIAIDRDPTVRPYFERFRRAAGVNARFLRGDFSIVLSQLAENGVRADAILLDLGVSSMQLDRPERGFSYATDAPLDMRMDPSADVSARRARQRGGGARAREDLPPVRGGALRAADRARDRPPPAQAAVRAHGRARRHDQGGDPRAGPVRRGPPGEARFPGLADRGQRGAGRARGRAPGRRRDAPAGRSSRRDQLPLAGGPHRQAFLPGAGARLHLPARLPGVRLRPRARCCASSRRGRCGRAPARRR